MKRGLVLLVGLLGLALIVVVAMIGWQWYSQARTPPSRLVLGGTRVANDALDVSSGNLVIVTPRPGIYFGTVRKPGSAEEFSYVILFRYGTLPAGLTERINSHSQANGNPATTTDAIELGGKRIEAGYCIELNEARNQVATQTLTIGGTNMDLSAGQVFLIDLTQPTPVYRQKKLELPPITSKLMTTAEVERVAEEIRAKLAEQDEELRGFLQ